MFSPRIFDPRRWPRETRLLVVTIVLSLVVLLVLARFRFPEQQPLALPVQPLQQFAARAAFDDLGASVIRAAARVRPSLIVVARAPAAETARSFSLEDVLRQDVGEPVAEYALALRFRPDLAVVVSGGRPLALRGADARLLEVRRRDDVRGLTVVRVPASDDGWRPLETATNVGAQYLLVSEAVAGDVATRPLFGGQAGEVASPHWDTPLLALGQQVQAAAGALVFALDGSFVGAVVRAGSGSAIVPADALLAAAERAVNRPSRVPTTIGVHLQALDAMLAAATGADFGVAITAVDPDGPAAGALLAGDVITAVGDRPAATPAATLLLIAALEPSAPVSLQVVRSGQVLTVPVTPRPVQTERAPASSDIFGASLRASSRGAVVTDVERPSSAHRAGLVTGDVITSLAGAGGVTPARVRAAYAAMPAGSHLVLAIERGGVPLLVALNRPAP